MNILHKMLAAFIAILVFGFAQGIFSSWSIDNIVGDVEEIASSIKTADAARATEELFLKAKSTLKNATDGIQFQSRKTTIPKFKRYLANIEQQLQRGKTASMSAETQQTYADVVNKMNAWKKNGLVLLGEMPATLVPTPNVVMRQEQNVLAQLEKLTTQALADAERIELNAISNAEKASHLVWTIVIASFVLGLIVAYGLAVSLTNPLAKIETAMSQLSVGKTEFRLSETERQDEIGSMAQALEVFRRNLQEKKRLEREAEKTRLDLEKHEQQEQRTALEQKKLIETLSNGLSRLADGDLSARVAVTSSDNFSQIKMDFNNAVEQLRNMFNMVSRHTSGASVAAHEISGRTQQITSQTDDISLQLNMTATSMSQLAKTVAKNAEDAKQAHSEASEASVLAGEGRDNMEDFLTAIKKIESSSAEISSVLDLVRSIAVETNILALNASVEAANAGEQAQGFQVIAGEIRDLSARVSSAIKEVSNLIDISNENVANGMVLATDVKRALENISISTAKAADSVTQISVVSQQQAEEIGDTSLAISQIDTTTKANAGLVQQTEMVSRNAMHAVEELKSVVAKFKTEHRARGEPSKTNAA